MTHDDGIRISVIIPTFNSAMTIAGCVAAVVADPFEAKEIIVVDDCSSDATREILGEFDCRLIELEENSGPARARNAGAAQARGEILFFVDSDIFLADHSVSIVDRYYREHPLAEAVIGMYAKTPANGGSFSQYMALWRFYTWTHPTPTEFSFFIASCGTIRQAVFAELGGFDTVYRGAEVEDYEFGHRLGARHPIFLLPELQGVHRFPGFMKCMRNYFSRSRKWFELFLRRRRFDTGQANASTGVSVVFAVAWILSGLAAIVISNPFAGALSGMCLLAYLVTISGFLRMAYQERGADFAVYAGVVHLLLSLAVAVGVGAALLRLPFTKARV